MLTFPTVQLGTIADSFAWFLISSINAFVNPSVETPRFFITWTISNILSILFGVLVAIWIDARKLDEKKAFWSVELL